MLLEMTNGSNYLNLGSRYYFKKIDSSSNSNSEKQYSRYNFGSDMCTICVVPGGRDNVMKALLYYY